MFQASVSWGAPVWKCYWLKARVERNVLFLLIISGQIFTTVHFLRNHIYKWQSLWTCGTQAHYFPSIHYYISDCAHSSCLNCHQSLSYAHIQAFVELKRDLTATTLLPVISAQLYVLKWNHLSAKGNNREATTSCSHEIRNLICMFCLKDPGTVFSIPSTSPGFLLSFFPLYFVSQPPSQADFPPCPFHFTQMFARKKKKKSAHISLRPEGQKMCSSAANRKPLKDSVICRSSRGVTLLGFQWTNGNGALEGSVVKRGSEVASSRGKRKGMEVWHHCLMFRHFAWEQEWIKDDYVSERVSMCERCLPQLFHLLHRGGYCHCLEVFSCVPLGPTRRLEM